MGNFISMTCGVGHAGPTCQRSGRRIASSCPPSAGAPPHRNRRTPPCPRSRRRCRGPQLGSTSVAGGAAPWPQEAVALPALYRFRSEYPHHGEAPASGVSRHRDEGGSRRADLPYEQGRGGDPAAVPVSRCCVAPGGGCAAPPRCGRAAPAGVRAVRGAKRLLPPRSRPGRRRDLPPHQAHPDPPPLPRVGMNSASLAANCALLCCAMCYLLVYCDLYNLHNFTCALLSPGVLVHLRAR